MLINKSKINIVLCFDNRINVISLPSPRTVCRRVEIVNDSFSIH